MTAAGGPRIAASNEAAESAGLAVGEPLADARAKAGVLQVRDIDAAADDAALRRLALWATRYTPTASLCDDASGADGFFLDIEGAAHLFGGEESLIADLAGRLANNFGLSARIAVAATPGAAWALSRLQPAPLLVLPRGQEAAALTPLPIEALRLSPDTRMALRRLGFKTVGALFDQPRAPFAARFAGELLRRLDQALDRRDEPLAPVIAPPVYHSVHYLLEPILTQPAVVGRATRLMKNLVHALARDDVGARALRLCLYNVDGTVVPIDIALTLPTRDVTHVARLIDLKLEALTAAEDVGFGFEAVGLAVTCAEPMPARQAALHVDSDASHASQGDAGERSAALVDALRQRLGPNSVRCFEAVASHLPERAERLVPVTIGASAAHSHGNERDIPAWSAPEPTTGIARPLLLLPQAEPTEVTALVPDGPPRRFSWRGVTYDVAGAQGPERIAGEWWRQTRLPARHRASGDLDSRLCGNERQQFTRDYFLVEDAEGHRFWLFREGIYGRETAAARWFVHGLFA